jgi:hypothetical protein
MAKEKIDKSKDKFNELKDAAMVGPSEPDAPGAASDQPEKKQRHRRTRAEIEASKRAKVERPIAQCANPLFIPLLKLPFEIWSKGTVDDMKLSDAEAEAMALPITQLVEYYLPAMPEIWAVWTNLSIQAFGVMSIRLAVLKTIRDQKKAAAQASGGASGDAVGMSSGQPGDMIKFYTPKSL